MSQRKEKRVPGIVGNRYRIVSKIGSGTYGTVYLGMDNKTGQKVAIKHMTEAAGSLEQLLKLREVRSLQKMSDNPCVVQLIDALYLPDSGSFLIMELMDCDLLAFLRHYAQSRTHVPEEVVARIMYRVFSALARLHQSGYFHRDMKPENILVNKDGVAKLCDFGLVRDMRSTSPLTSYIATRWYRSPEMLLEAQDYGPPVDMWAAGCIMLEVLQCRPIFEGKDNLETFQEVIEKVGGFDNKAVPISAATGGGGEWLQGEYLVRKNSKFSKIYEQARARFKKSNGSGLIGHIKRDLSSEAVNLIARLLTHDPSKRLTAAQALAHPFCARARAEDPQCAPSSHRPIPRFISSVMMQSVSPSGASKHSDTPPLIKNEAQTSSSLSPVARAANQKVLSNTAPTFCSNEYNNVTSTKPLPQISNFDNNNNNNLRKHLPPINPSAAGQRLPSLSASNPQIPPLNAERVEIRRRQLFDSSEMSSVLGNRLPPSHNVLSSNNNAVSNNRNDANTLSSIVFNQQQQQQSSNIKTRLAAGNINNSNNINSNNNTGVLAHGAHSNQLVQQQQQQQLASSSVSSVTSLATANNANKTPPSNHINTSPLSSSAAVTNHQQLHNSHHVLNLSPPPVNLPFGCQVAPHFLFIAASPSPHPANLASRKNNLLNNNDHNNNARTNISTGAVSTDSSSKTHCLSQQRNPQQQQQQQQVNPIAIGPEDFAKMPDFSSSFFFLPPFSEGGYQAPFAPCQVGLSEEELQKGVASANASTGGGGIGGWINLRCQVLQLGHIDACCHALKEGKKHVMSEEERRERDRKKEEERRKREEEKERKNKEKEKEKEELRLKKEEERKKKEEEMKRQKELKNAETAELKAAKLRLEEERQRDRDMREIENVPLARLFKMRRGRRSSVNGTNENIEHNEEA
eukprot:GDKK01011556.1.p1 GENE.GDKK01011556.1~~GDKK01011556.1.p1  ORF type:complete len:912 (-),score=300.59 GDKK01011556.1:129-2864(-)